jgi:uncharacterized membrane protein YdjX (TVP38/TMEM64 family)
MPDTPQIDAVRSMHRKMLRTGLAVLSVAALILVIRAVGWRDLFSGENIERVESFVRSSGPWAPAAFVALCVLACLLFSPAVPWLLLAAVFGPVWGTIYSSVGLTLGASAAFLLARHTLRPWVEHMAARNPTFRKIDEGVRRQGWRMVMTTRLVPVFPFNMQNFAYGLTGISFLTYVLVSWLCMLPATIAYVLTGCSLVDGQGDIRKALGYLAAGGVLIVLLSYAPSIVRRWLQGDVDRT